ncbi:hypothetical protein [Nocardia camponoti]|uniref:PPE domain-containing protein n=1 Tax=Nocardia camponoti TaxID=1616106 RepID=A0A917QU36_9NOCA|nr:hypothetical protein [Nocardia camponoti]GGK67482.1 hypothetical protein GCM10011591_44560 [Nocardia camponoti]
MKAFDPPSITNPENVDHLTHQQIIDAFNAVINETHSMVTTWQQSKVDFRESTASFLAAIRAAADGKWTGASADAAITATTHYAAAADDLDELFADMSNVVNNTATIAVMAKAFMPKVVAVTANQTTDPQEYDKQSREAKEAQDEARRIMRGRYIVGFQHQDTQIPTFPPATKVVAAGPGADGGNPSGAPGSNVVGVPGSSPSAPGAGQPGANPAQPSPDSTVPAGADESLTGGSPQNGTDDSKTQTAGTTQSPSQPTTSTPADTARPNTSPSTNPTIPGAPGGRAGTPSGGAPGGRAGTPSGGTPGSPSRPQVPGSSIAAPGGGAQSSPAAARAGSPGAHGASGPMGGAPMGGRPGDDKEKQDRKVNLVHPENTEELLGVIKFVPPVLGADPTIDDGDR